MNELIKLLKQNARFSNEQLAAMLGTTPKDVAAQIEQLEKDMDAAATDFVRLRELSEKKEQSEALLELSLIHI